MKIYTKAFDRASAKKEFFEMKSKNDCILWCELEVQC